MAWRVHAFEPPAGRIKRGWGHRDADGRVVKALIGLSLARRFDAPFPLAVTGACSFGGEPPASAFRRADRSRDRSPGDARVGLDNQYVRAY